MKNKFTLLKIRKTKNFLLLTLVTPGGKKFRPKPFFKFLLEELLIKVSERSERKMALVVEGSVCYFELISSL